jgi:folate-dependent phosphoribosylglycinamide formyltransferase PurN
MTLRVGLVTGSAGHTLREFASAVRNRDVNLQVVTDRPCGAEAVCREMDLSHARIEDPDRIGFSQSVAEHFRAGKVAFALLTFNRIVSAELFKVIPTFNIHPSLLPAFPGLNAIADAFLAGVGFVGATLHLVTEHVDEGPIIGQVCAPIHRVRSVDELQDISFIQRIYLTLLAVDLSERQALDVDLAAGSVSNVGETFATAHANPAIQDARLVRFVEDLQQTMNLNVFRSSGA